MSLAAVQKDRKKVVRVHVFCNIAIVLLSNESFWKVDYSRLREGTTFRYVPFCPVCCWEEISTLGLLPDSIDVVVADSTLSILSSEL